MSDVKLLGTKNPARPVDYRYIVTIGEPPAGLPKEYRVDLDGKNYRSRGVLKVEPALKSSGLFDVNDRMEFGVKVYVRFSESSFLGDENWTTLTEVLRFLQRRNFQIAVVLVQLPTNIGVWASDTLEIALPVREPKRREFKNPAKRPDIFDHMRELDNALKTLSREISAINDPDRQTAEIRSVRAYLDAFRVFIDDKDHRAPDTIPSEVPSTLKKKIGKINWATISDHAQGWADKITRFVDLFF